MLRFFCFDIKIDNPELLKSKGPLLLASNHPNSFLDAIIYDILFEIPIWSLARGDAFSNPKIKKLLHHFKMMPVYRKREGDDNLMENYQTFDNCVDIFKQNGAVLIFSEALCINEWHLRSIKKGTARLAFKAWRENIPLEVLPISINYSSFFTYGKLIHVNIGTSLHYENFKPFPTDGLQNKHFTEAIKEQLRKGGYEFRPHDKESLYRYFSISEENKKRKWLFPFSVLGALVNFPAYLIAKTVCKKLSKNNVHYDGYMLAFLLLFYPLYLLFTGGFIALLFSWVSGLFYIVFTPALLWSYVKYKVRIDKSFQKKDR